ncbi:hypothetical protein, partial [Paenibacillus glucanolyticus]|uniref:hypothetical protein n=1 Tax=Paenibacillus glucanolyticus TaxID=59843 RepID=UPI00097A57C9
NTSEAIDSFSQIINFQVEFEKAKNSIDEEKEIKRKQLQEIGLDHEIIEETLANITRKNIRAKTDEFSHLYNEKRPLERRKMIRKLLTEKVQLTAIVALENNGLEVKDNQLYEKLARFLPSYVKPNTKNDGVLVIFMNTKIKKRFAGRDIMEIEDLINAQTYLENELKEEVERILYGIA